MFLTILDHPLFIRLAIACSILLFGFAYGHHLGYTKAHDALIAYQAQEKTLTTIQASKTQAEIERAKNAQNQITQDWKTRYAGLAMSYAGPDARRVQYITLKPADPLPTSADSSQSSHATTSEQRPYTVAGCAQDALQIEMFQRWIQKNNFPIEGAQ